MKTLPAEPWQPSVNPLGKDNHVPQHDQQATAGAPRPRPRPRLHCHDAVSLTGGGAFNPGTGFVHSGGGFRCTEDVAGLVPLNGCLAGQGVRWDTEALLASTGFKCTGAAGEARKTATTGHGTVVLQSDFYRAGDGIDESFRAQLIVSQHDIAPDIPGVQNVWVQGIGCGSAIVHFSSPS